MHAFIISVPASFLRLMSLTMLGIEVGRASRIEMNWRECCDNNTRASDPSFTRTPPVMVTRLWLHAYRLGMQMRSLKIGRETNDSLPMIKRLEFAILHLRKSRLTLTTKSEINETSELVLELKAALSSEIPAGRESGPESESGEANELTYVALLS
ncbi:hypothetical protein B0H13DRAFT_2400794 [Mycena leptocephala]|nr:hypothetical protein B0H13DRAFT_2400794 [Mycena leptocephala]